MPALPGQGKSYRLSGREIFRYGLTGAGCMSVLAFLFFHSVRAVLFLAPCGALYPFFIRKKLAAKKQERLLLQWKEAILAMGVSLSAGYSVENAFVQTWKDLRQRFGPEQPIVEAFAVMVSQLRMNVPAERALEAFADQSGLDEVKNFADIFHISRRAGTDLVRMIAESGEMIAARVEVKEELLTLMTSVRLEGKIMNVVPLCILAYINFTSPRFFSPMYDTLTGRVIMTAGFFSYLAICWYSLKLMEVEL